jgi:hypothetical protein
MGNKTISFEFKRFDAVLQSGEFSKMFHEAFGIACTEKLLEHKPEEVGILFDHETKVSFFSFQREKDFIRLIHLGYLRTAKENRRFTYSLKIVEALHNIGFQNVGTEIPAKGRQEIINCLLLGFEIIGCHHTNNKLQLLMNHAEENPTPTEYSPGTNFITSGTIH